MSDSKTLSDLAKEFVLAVESRGVDPTLSGTLDEALEVLGAYLQDGLNGVPVPTKEPAYLIIANTFAAIAERTGKSEELRTLVPEAARSEAIRTAFADQAPDFAKLCV